MAPTSTRSRRCSCPPSPPGATPSTSGTPACGAFCSKRRCCGCASTTPTASASTPPAACSTPARPTCSPRWPRLLRRSPARAACSSPKTCATAPPSPARWSDGGYGLDSQWIDDLHGQVRAYATPGEAYWSHYDGATAHQIAETLARGWTHADKVARKQDDLVGSPPEGPYPRFTHYLDDHDLTGNRPHGDRLTATISPALYRALSAVLLFAPELPLLWMGQEWAATTPFPFLRRPRNGPRGGRARRPAAGVRPMVAVRGRTPRARRRGHLRRRPPRLGRSRAAPPRSRPRPLPLPAAPPPHAARQFHRRGPLGRRAAPHAGRLDAPRVPCAMG